MNIAEAAQLLGLAGTFDRFIALDKANATTWQRQLHDVSYEPAADAVMAFYRDWNGSKQLTIAYILDAVEHTSRKSADQIAADVHSARARGLVPKTWPESEPIPADALAAITAAREEVRARAVRQLEIA